MVIGNRKINLLIRRKRSSADFIYGFTSLFDYLQKYEKTIAIENFSSQKERNVPPIVRTSVIS